ncbi:RusA family crossover junction endodeoxyribonuclease [Arthrobacter sp. Z1-15]
MTRTTQFTIPAPEFPPVRKRATGKLQEVKPWLNSNLRLHRQQEAKLTAAWRLEAALRLAERGWDLTPYDGPVHVTAHVWKPRAGRYDPGNLYPTAKACLDGIVDAGLLADDDWKHVIGPDMRHGGKGPAALVITITQEEPNG